MFTVYTREDIDKIKVGDTFNGNPVVYVGVSKNGEDEIVSVLTGKGMETRAYHLVPVEGLYTDYQYGFGIYCKDGNLTMQRILDFETGNLTAEDYFQSGSVEEEMSKMLCIIDRGSEKSNVKVGDEAEECFMDNSLQAVEMNFEYMSNLTEIDKHNLRSKVLDCCKSIIRFCKEQGIYYESGKEPLRVVYTGINKSTVFYPVATYKVTSEGDVLDYIKGSKYGVYLYMLAVAPNGDMALRLAIYDTEVKFKEPCEA